MGKEDPVELDSSLTLQRDTRDTHYRLWGYTLHVNGDVHYSDSYIEDNKKRRKLCYRKDDRAMRPIAYNECLSCLFAVRLRVKLNRVFFPHSTSSKFFHVPLGTMTFGLRRAKVLR